VSTIDCTYVSTNDWERCWGMFTNAIAGYMYVYICIHVSIYEYVYLCICICMYLYEYVYLHIFMYIYIYIYTCIHTFACTPICIYIHIYVLPPARMWLVRMIFRFGTPPVLICLNKYHHHHMCTYRFA
jgi:hypothetical protein